MVIQGTFAAWKLCWPGIPAISATRQRLPKLLARPPKRDNMGYRA